MSDCKSLTVFRCGPAFCKKAGENPECPYGIGQTKTAIDEEMGKKAVLKK